MADPDRLLDDPALSPLARAVLRSADGDAPGADGRRKIAAAIGLGSIGGGGGAAATAARAASGLWWKLPVIVIGAIGAGTTAYLWSRGSSEPAPRASTPIAIAPAPRAAPAPAPIPAAAPIAVPVPVAVVVPAAAPPPAAQPARRAPTKTRAPVAAAETETGSATETETETETETDSGSGSGSGTVGAAATVDPRSLAAEVALLDRARGELQRGDTTAALTTLDLHAREFPGGALAAEAELLRIQATVARGDHAGAADLAHRFLQRFPDSPLAPRARAVLDGAPRSP